MDQVEEKKLVMANLQLLQHCFAIRSLAKDGEKLLFMLKTGQVVRSKRSRTTGLMVLFPGSQN